MALSPARAFLSDTNAICSNIYDVGVYAWLLEQSENGTFGWKTVPPHYLRTSIPISLSEAQLEEIPTFLLHLARKVGLAHTVQLNYMQTLDLDLGEPKPFLAPVSNQRNHRAYTILAPPNDTRIRGDRVISCALPENTFVLLPPPEECGILVSFGYCGPIKTKATYGLMVWGLPRAVTLIDLDEARPESESESIEMSDKNVCQRKFSQTQNKT